MLASGLDSGQWSGSPRPPNRCEGGRHEVESQVTIGLASPFQYNQDRVPLTVAFRICAIAPFAGRRPIDWRLFGRDASFPGSGKLRFGSNRVADLQRNVHMGRPSHRPTSELPAGAGTWPAAILLGLIGLLSCAGNVEAGCGDYVVIGGRSSGVARVPTSNQHSAPHPGTPCRGPNCSADGQSPFDTPPTLRLSVPDPVALAAESPHEADQTPGRHGPVPAPRQSLGGWPRVEHPPR